MAGRRGRLDLAHMVANELTAAAVVCNAIRKITRQTKHSI